MLKFFPNCPTTEVIHVTTWHRLKKLLTSCQDSHFIFNFLKRVASRLYGYSPVRFSNGYLRRRSIKFALNFMKRSATNLSSSGFDFLALVD